MSKSIRKAVREIRYSFNHCAIADLRGGDYYKLPEEIRPAIEKALQANFDHWWNSWIEPNLKDLESKVPKRRSTKSKGEGKI